MMNSGVNFYPSAYGPPSYPGLPNTYGVTSPSIPNYYNTRYAQPQPKSEQSAAALQPQPIPPAKPNHRQQPQSSTYHYQQQQQQQHQSRLNSQQQGEGHTSYKLYDLHGSSQGDLIRLIFAYVGVPYKDKRLKHDEWMKIKEQIPFQQLPILRVDGQFRICHLHAIIRYLAREYKLYGADKYDQAIIDMITEIARQLQEKLFEQTDTPAARATPDRSLQDLITDFALAYLKQFEQLYSIFDRRGPFYLGTQVSLADLIVYNTINHLIKIDAKLLDNYARLKEARRNLEKHPGIADFIKGKPTEPSKTHRRRSLQGHRHRTKSPTPNANTYRQHRGQRRSEDRHKSAHHHHHYYHCPYHERRRSRDPAPASHSKPQSDESLQTPTLMTEDKEPVATTKPKPQASRASRSPSSLRKPKERTPSLNPKQRLIRSSISPSIRKAEKEPAQPLAAPAPTAVAPTAAATTVVVPVPEPAPAPRKEHKSELKAK